MALHEFIDQARVLQALVAAHGLDLARLAEGQSPTALFITCSDSRVVPTWITGNTPGDLMEMRTYGGVIPRYDPEALAGEVLTIEHAVDIVGVRDVIVCGHTHCDVGGGTPSAVQARVLADLAVLSGYPCIAPRLAEGAVRLHGWFYDVETGATLAHDPDAGAFLPI